MKKIIILLIIICSLCCSVQARNKDIEDGDVCVVGAQEKKWVATEAAKVDALCAIAYYLKALVIQNESKIIKETKSK